MKHEDSLQDYLCPTHSTTRLMFVLKGGAGYCSQCRMYVQAAGVLVPSKATGSQILQKEQKAKYGATGRSKHRRQG